MGARAEQQLALSFLAALVRLWARHPGTYKVREAEVDLVPALGQMCIKALAADVRDSVPRSKQNRRVVGELRSRDGSTVVPTLRTVVNKIIHGSPERVEVTVTDIRLHYVNAELDASRSDWVELWVSGPRFIGQLDDLLFKHRHLAPAREEGIARLLADLGTDRLMPTSIE